MLFFVIDAKTANLASNAISSTSHDLPTFMHLPCLTYPTSISCLAIFYPTSMETTRHDEIINEPILERRMVTLLDSIEIFFIFGLKSCPDSYEVRFWAIFTEI